MIDGFRAMLAHGIDRATIAKKIQALCVSLNTDAEVTPEGLTIVPSRAVPTHTQLATA